MHEREHVLAEPVGPHSATMHATEIPVLGIVTRFVSNSADVLAAVEHAFGAWRTLPPSAVQSGTFRTVRINVQPDGARSAAPATDVAHVVTGDGRLTLRSNAAFGMSDPLRGEAVASIGVELLRDALRFRCDVLEALTLSLLTRADRQPLHAAALVIDRAGLLLCGRSGAGKSTLAYAAARAGMRALSEDIVFIQMQPRLRVWGRRTPFHLRPSAAANFAELAAAVPARLPNGREKVVVPADTAAEADARAPVDADTAAMFVDHCGICILGERRDVPEHRRLTTDEVLALIDLSDPGFDAFAGSIKPAVAALAERGAWMLHPSTRADESVPLLAAMLDEVAAACDGGIP